MTKAAVVAALLLVLAAPARAENVSRQELEALAAAAASDAAARERLRAVDSIDGEPVDLRSLLAGASPEEIEARLEALAAPAPGRARASRDAARDEAREILSERRFRRSELPRPLRGVLAWIGDRVRPLGRPLDWLADRIPGGRAALWTVLGAIVLLFAAAVAARLASRRSAALLEQRRGTTPARADPRRLEREADEAERRGDLERALRLRFRAGLLRLDERKVIRFRDSLTSGEVARRLRSRAFDELARSFDEVVYGRRAPSADDVRRAREGWSSVLDEARAA